MTRRQVTIFFDIDGVLSIPDKRKPLDEYVTWKRGLPAWPVPLAFPLIRAVTQQQALHPVWLSAWGTDACLWNEQAGTPPWKVGYYLTPRQEHFATNYFFPGIQDSKLVAVRYYLRKATTPTIIWIEDGFSDEAKRWADQEKGHRVVLLNTMQEPLLSVLLSSPENPEQAAQNFIDTYFWCKDEPNSTAENRPFPQ